MTPTSPAIAVTTAATPVSTPPNELQKDPRSSLMQRRYPDRIGRRPYAAPLPSLGQREHGLDVGTVRLDLAGHDLVAGRERRRAEFANRSAACGRASSWGEKRGCPRTRI